MTRNGKQGGGSGRGISRGGKLQAWGAQTEMLLWLHLFLGLHLHPGSQVLLSTGGSGEGAPVHRAWEAVGAALGALNLCRGPGQFPPGSSRGGGGGGEPPPWCRRRRGWRGEGVPLGPPGEAEEFPFGQLGMERGARWGDLSGDEWMNV